MRSKHVKTEAFPIHTSLTQVPARMQCEPAKWKSAGRVRVFEYMDKQRFSEKSEPFVSTRRPRE